MSLYSEPKQHHMCYGQNTPARAALPLSLCNIPLGCIHVITWRTLLAALWITWLIFWVVSARRVKATRWKEPLWSQLIYRMPLFVAALLLFLNHVGRGILTLHFLPHTAVAAACGVTVVALGLGLAVWARRHLGPNWSSAVTIKEDHALIQSGPYKFVRHPIYSGLLLGLAGTAVVFGELRDCLAFALALFALIYKAQIEEERMRATFPEYEAYRKKTAALFPYIY